MFNIGPMEFVVLALVGIVVLGPDRLPDFARDAARLLRTLRDMATGARQQLREELGPEFADVDLRNLNPRTAVQRAVFGDDLPDLRKYSPTNFVRDAIYGEDEDVDSDGTSAEDEPAASDEPVWMRKEPAAGRNGAGANRAGVNRAGANRAGVNRAGANRARASGAGANGARANEAGGNDASPRPRPRPRPRTAYDEDAT